MSTHEDELASQQEVSPPQSAKPKRGQVLDAFNTEIYKRLAAEGISIPFPQRDRHIINQ